MQDSKKFVVVDGDGDDRRLLNDESEWDTAEAAHAAVDNWQQRDNDMSPLPWTVVERTQVVLGSYRRENTTKFVNHATYKPQS